jgi:signal transduction histidine kinase
MFQPFFTSKAKGIGLGLAMARSAVQGHGGELTFDRTPEGSRFTISIPQEP